MRTFVQEGTCIGGKKIRGRDEGKERNRLTDWREYK